jgi:hypothetical protein
VEQGPNGCFREPVAQGGAEPFFLKMKPHAQGLKPRKIGLFCGTAEAVPFYKTCSQPGSSIACEAALFQNILIISMRVYRVA